MNKKSKEVFPSVKTPTIQEIAKKHKVTVAYLSKQLVKGIKIEHEHTGDAKMAREIALDHLNEKPNYYSKLKKYVEMTDVAIDYFSKLGHYLNVAQKP